jgi:Tfp pilus assembly protein PilF
MHTRLFSLLFVPCVFALALLGGCAGPSPALTAQDIDGVRFAPPTVAPDATAIFALSDEMRAYLHGEIASQTRSKGPRRALFDALYNTEQLKVKYDDTLTRTAAQTFAARQGNCLSLLIMTAALAREMGIDVEYRSVQIDPAWSRSEGLYFASGHVNITLGKRLGESSGYTSAGLTIDFLPPKDIEHQRTRSIDEATVRAMYLNNRAAEMLNAGQVDNAYWWVRAAIAQDSGFLGAYNTLGVVLRRHGDTQAARRVFALILSRTPDDALVMSNQMQTLTALGEKDEAARLQARLNVLLPEPPFHFFEQGLQAMRRQDYALARSLFLRELQRDPDYHEFHFWLAQAELRLGDMGQAEHQLELAMHNSTSPHDESMYAAKRDHLRAQLAR